MVWALLGSAGNLVEKLDEENDVKLLTLRMKKNELIIIPGMCCPGECDGMVDGELLMRGRSQVHSGYDT
jgi:hypothetical protein